jgi:hypothetical protein
MGTTIPNAETCSKNCDPISSTGCPAGWGCHPYHNTTPVVDLTDCDPAGGGGQNAVCTDNTSCQAGYSCVNVGGATPDLRCLKNCVYPSGTCPSPSSCAGYVDPPVIGGVEYGVCF